MEKIWYLSAIEIIDTQVVRRGRQYHRNPPPYKNRPTKKNRIYKIKRPPPPPQPPPPNPTHTTTIQPKPTQNHRLQKKPSYKKETLDKKIKLVMSIKIKRHHHHHSRR